MSEEHLVTFNLELNVEQAYAEIRKLQTLLYRTMGFMRRLGLPENVDEAIRKIQRVIMTLRILQTAIRSLEFALAGGGPISLALAFLGIASGTMSIVDMIAEG